MKFKPKVYFTAVFITISIASLYSNTATGNPLGDCFSLSRELNLSESICEGKTPSNFSAEIESINADKVRSLQQLGVALRRLGYLEESQAALKQALNESPEDGSIALSLGNLQQQMYRRAISLYKSTDDPATRSAQTREAIAKAKASLAQYQAIVKSREANNRILAELNWMDLWSSLEQDISELKVLQQQNLPIGTRIAQSQSEAKLDTEGKTEARVSLAESLLRTSDLNPSFANLSRTNAEEVLKNAEAVGDMYSTSRAYGVKGLLLKRSGQNRDVIAELGKAASTAQSISANDLAYKWDAELAKLSETEGNRNKALEYYKASIDSLQQIRKGILQLNPQVQYDFRDRVEPIYREYIGLLLDKNSPDLKEVIRVNDKLKVGELENYLQCNLTKLTSLLDLPPETLPDAAVYVIKLPNRYAVIVRRKDGSLKHRIIDAKNVNASLKILKENLQNDGTEGLDKRLYQKLFGNLYQALFAPVEPLLPQSGTLVMTVDSELQSIPWSMLFDGQQYLMQKYSIAYSLGSEALPPKKLEPSKLNALVAGLSEQTNQIEFSALPSVAKEVQGVQTQIKSKTLLNREFTGAALIKNGQKSSVIHLATHAETSSDPNSTFILGWNERITLSSLSGLTNVRGTNPLELLVLSACQTAKGDNRATLGLAGTLVQSGARSTLATLWLVDDDSQAMLMQEFYRALTHGKSKAEALRSAQIALLNSESYSNPYYWGSAVLVGSPL
jgi:CHAT domain-containing protein/DNA-binding transcriptional regulator/RsmH inhibitor MraZ